MIGIPGSFLAFDVTIGKFITGFADFFGWLAAVVAKRF